MDVEAKPRKVRIVSGEVEEVELQLNILAESYGAIMWNFSVVDNRMWMTVVMIHESEMRKAALASRAMPGRMQ